MKTIQDKDVKFLLKDPRADRPTLIYLVYRFDSGRFKYSTEQTIEPYQWDTNAQRVRLVQKPRSERERFETINGHLERHRAALKQVVTALQLAGSTISNDLIKKHLDQTLNRVKINRTKKENLQTPLESFTGYIERFVEEARVGRRLNAKSSQYSKFTLNGYLKLKRL